MISVNVMMKTLELPFDIKLIIKKWMLLEFENNKKNLERKLGFPEFIPRTDETYLPYGNETVYFYRFNHHTWIIRDYSILQLTRTIKGGSFGYSAAYKNDSPNYTSRVKNGKLCINYLNILVYN
jgi:hypothetical protein